MEARQGAQLRPRAREARRVARDGPAERKPLLATGQAQACCLMLTDGSIRTGRSRETEGESGCSHVVADGAMRPRPPATCQPSDEHGYGVPEVVHDDG
jgi:hypothetical protein